MTAPPAQRMQCMEVWSGSQLTQRAIEFSGLDAWVYSKPFGDASHGGDIYYASSCATGRITRLLLADVAGHGHAVSGTATGLRALMRRFVNRLDQAEFVRLLNHRFTALSQEGAFATAIVTTFFAPTRRLTVCNAGHPRPLLYRSAESHWTLLATGTGPAIRNLPLGWVALAQYENFDVELAPGDCLLSYTDALIEARDADGAVLGEAGLLRLVRKMGPPEAKSLIDRLLKEIAAGHPANLREDDVTVLMVRANGRTNRHPFRDQLRAAGRFAIALIQALNPRAERPPFPDATVANIGGAIIPSLSQRWRA